GQNPYPVYAAIDKTVFENEKDDAGASTWFEFTPHEAGYPAYGVFVDVRYFGSKFNGGVLEEKQCERDQCYLQGVYCQPDCVLRLHVAGLGCNQRLWGSAFGSMVEIKENMWRTDLKHSRKCNHKNSYTPHKIVYTVIRHLVWFSIIVRVSPNGYWQDPVLTVMRSRLLSWERNNGDNPSTLWGRVKRLFLFFVLYPEYNFSFTVAPTGTIEMTQAVVKTWDCVRNWCWGKNYNFLFNYRKDGDFSFFFLLEEELIHLVDAGLAINSAYPLMLRQERQVDLILSFDYSEGDPFLTVKETARYCQKNQIPFPNVKIPETERDNPLSCYIFKGNNAPTVMHFPLFNRVNDG
uniref:PLA2c domain-containing protein n=1 Tax=Latimeria chalumnae TaxID=7897 RepID=H2ZTD3_LATCH